MLRDKESVAFEDKRCHDLVAFLNEASDSPWRDRIAMVGAGDRIIGQSSFISSLKKLFKKQHLFASTDPDFFEERADLRAYVSDPNHRYFARTLLKLALAGDILLFIRAANQAIEAEWISMIQRWKGLLATVFPDSAKCYLLKFVPLIGSGLN